MESDTRTMLLLYWIAIHNTTGINRNKAILAQYRICTIVFTGKLKVYMKHILLHRLQSNEHISSFASVVWVMKMFVKNGENKGNCNLFVFGLPTYIMIKIADGYKMVGRYYCMIMESLDWF